MNSKKVSVIIAVYNAERYLCECLDSVINQTLQEIEIICIDDGSTDSSWDILKNYAARDSRIKVIHQENTGPQTGAAEARNRGLMLAEGEYLSILDADDFFEREMLERAYKFAVNNNLDIVTFDGYRYDHVTKKDYDDFAILHGEFLPEQDVVSLGDIHEKIFQLTIGAAWNCLYRREFVKNNNLTFQPLQHADDFLFVNLAFAKCSKLGFLREKFVHYRKNNPDSQSELKDDWMESPYNALKRLKEELISSDLYDLTRRSFVNRAANYLVWYLFSTKNPKSFEALLIKIKSQYLEEFEIEDKEEEFFWDKDLYKIISEIKRLSVMEHEIKCRIETYKKSGGHGLEELVFPSAEISMEDKIVIYGAGNMGLLYYLHYLIYHDFNIVLWADKRYSELGEPIAAPERIKEVCYDKVIIAVEKEELAKAIFEYLVGLGVPPQKIVWKDNILRRCI